MYISLAERMGGWGRGRHAIYVYFSAETGAVVWWGMKFGNGALVNSWRGGSFRLLR